MAIRPECHKCLQELDEPGAILLSPPYEADEADEASLRFLPQQVWKLHLCVSCYSELREWLNNG